jgi:hypothetical protein
MSSRALLSLCLAAFAQAGELPRPSERLRALPGDDWLPQRQRPSATLALENPLPAVPLWLSECTLRQPVTHWLGAQVWLWSLRSEAIHGEALGAALTLHLPQAAFALHAQERRYRLDRVVVGRGRRFDCAFAAGDLTWRAGLRARWRDTMQWDGALQWLGSGLRLGIEREASPFGGDPAWLLGCQARLAPVFWLGLATRAQSADVLLAARRGEFRLRLAIAASGEQRGGIAVATEWLR